MPCPHPIVIDFRDPCLDGNLSDWWRQCALCDEIYNRTQHVLIPLRSQCEQAWGVNFRRFTLNDEDALEIAG
jgi:hypothetical protein